MKATIFIVLVSFFSLNASAQTFFSGQYWVHTSVFSDGELKKESNFKVETNGFATRTEYSNKIEIFLPDSVAKFHIYPEDDTLWIETVDRKYPSAVKTDLLPDKEIFGKPCKGIRITLDGGVIEAWFNPSVIMRPDFYSKQTAGGVKTIFTLTNGAIPLYLSLTSGDLVQIFEITKIESQFVGEDRFTLPTAKVLFRIPQKP